PHRQGTVGVSQGNRTSPVGILARLLGWSRTSSRCWSWTTRTRITAGRWSEPRGPHGLVVLRRKAVEVFEEITGRLAGALCVGRKKKGPAVAPSVSPKSPKSLPAGREVLYHVRTERRNLSTGENAPAGGEGAEPAGGGGGRAPV